MIDNIEIHIGPTATSTEIFVVGSRSPVCNVWGLQLSLSAKGPWRATLALYPTGTIPEPDGERLAQENWGIDGAYRQGEPDLRGRPVYYFKRVPPFTDHGF